MEEREHEILSALTIKDGNVGIGTDAPERALHIRGTGGVNDDVIIESNGSQNSGALIFYKSQTNKAPAKENDNLGAVVFRGYTGNNYANGAYIQSHARSNYDQSMNGDLRIFTTHNGQSRERLRIEPNGNIGVGIATPTAKLQVAGGAIMPAVGNSENAGILFPKDAYGGGGDRAYMRYYSRGGEHTTLEIGNKNDGEDIIMLSSAYTRVSTPHGWTDIGPKNATWSHFYTDRDRYYFDKEIRVDSGKIGSYNENLQLCVKGQGKVFIYDNGRVGINGVNTGKAVLHVRGAVTNNNFRKYNYLSYSGGNSNPVGWFDKSNNHVGVSIWADDRMVSSEYMAKSDLRIKSVIGVSDSQADLALLNQIKVTDYTHKDTVRYGTQKVKKVIGQQIADIYPEAVSTDNTDFIPDIMKIVHLKNGKFKLDNDIKLRAKDKIRLLFEDSTEEVVVLNRTEEWVEVASEKEGKAILYGREVHDFHTVDYEALAVLNISATQELFKRVQQLEQQLYQHSKTNFITQ